mgnify:FL=1
MSDIQVIGVDGSMYSGQFGGVKFSANEKPFLAIGSSGLPIGRVQEVVLDGRRFQVAGVLSSELVSFLGMPLSDTEPVYQLMENGFTSLEPINPGMVEGSDSDVALFPEGRPGDDEGSGQGGEPLSGIESMEIVDVTRTEEERVLAPQTEAVTDVTEVEESRSTPSTSRRTSKAR